jgi:hypothetical protein
MFTATILENADAAVTYPLVACSYPHLPLQRWSNYVRGCASGEIEERLVGMLDARGRYHAIFGYRVDAAQDAAGPLRVSHIATFQLAGNAIFQAVHETLGRLAREHNCPEVIIRPWALAVARGSAPGSLAGSVLSMASAANPGRTIN